MSQCCRHGVAVEAICVRASCVVFGELGVCLLKVAGEIGVGFCFHYVSHGSVDSIAVEVLGARSLFCVCDLGVWI